MFLHDAILEGVTSGNTEVSAERLPQRMSELEEVDSDGETGYQKEFNVRRFICLSTFPFCLCLFFLKVDLFVVTSLCSVFVSSVSMCESSQTQMMMPTSSRIALPMPSHVSHTLPCKPHPFTSVILASLSSPLIQNLTKLKLLRVVVLQAAISCPKQQIQHHKHDQPWSQALRGLVPACNVSHMH